MKFEFLQRNFRRSTLRCDKLNCSRLIKSQGLNQHSLRLQNLLRGAKGVFCQQLSDSEAAIFPVRLLTGPMPFPARERLPEDSLKRLAAGAGVAFVAVGVKVLRIGSVGLSQKPDVVVGIRNPDN